MVLRGQDMIVQCLLIEVHQRSGGVYAEELSGQLQHIIGITGLGGIVGKKIIQLAGVAEVFVVAVAAIGIGVVAGDRLPEEAGYIRVFLVAGRLIWGGGADDLRDLCIGMFASQGVYF